MSSRALDDPVLERRRLAALGEIRQMGDPVLRSRARAIVEFDEPLRDEAERMGRLMVDARGVGLAAPQIGSLRRLLVMRASEEDDVLALCNPEILWSSDEQETEVEGCLSIGEITVEVSRPTAIRVRAHDLAGDAVDLELEGFIARVAQHEIDHLDGVLILDRASPEQRREALRVLRDGG